MSCPSYYLQWVADSIHMYFYIGPYSSHIAATFVAHFGIVGTVVPTHDMTLHYGLVFIEVLEIRMVYLYDCGSLTVWGPVRP